MKRNKKQPLEVPPIETLEKELHRELYKKSYRSTLRSTVYTLITVAAVAVLVATLVLPVLQIWYVHDADLIRWRHSCLCFWFGI